MAYRRVPARLQYVRRSRYQRRADIREWHILTLVDECVMLVSHTRSLYEHVFVKAGRTADGDDGGSLVSQQPDVSGNVPSRASTASR